MNIATHILLATDFSKEADVAIAKTVDLATMLKAKLTVLNVHGHPPEPPEAVVSADDLSGPAISMINHYDHWKS